VLWIDFGSRIDDLESLLDPFPPTGACDDAAQRDESCNVPNDEKRKLAAPLTNISWSEADQRILASTLGRRQWITVAGAYLEWTRLVQRFGRRGSVLHGPALEMAMDGYVGMDEAQRILTR
jgi:hypothetical protein